LEIASGGEENCYRAEKFPERVKRMLDSPKKGREINKKEEDHREI